MALEYSLARWFPAAGARLIAVFVRRAELATAVSGRPGASAGPLRQPRTCVPRGSLAARGCRDAHAGRVAGRLHFKRWLRGVQWNRNDVEGAATLAVDIPDGGTPLFEVTIAPGRAGSRRSLRDFCDFAARFPGRRPVGERGDRRRRRRLATSRSTCRAGEANGLA